MRVVKRPQFRVLRISQESSQLTFALPTPEGADLVYSVRGSIEIIPLIGARAPSDREVRGAKLAVARAYGVATLKSETNVEGVPQQIEFHLSKPLRVPAAGKSVKAEMELLWPGLLTLPKYRSLPGPGHAFAVRPVKATLMVEVLWQAGFRSVAIVARGRIPMPTVAREPLLAACTLFCCCPPEKPKCKKLCLDIKVGPRAAGGAAVMDKAEVQKVIARVNEIWGCKPPGQCCIEFTVADADIHLLPAGLKADVKVQTGVASDEHKAAVNVDRSTKCYNLYYVETMTPVGAPAGKSYPGMTLKDPASVLVQDPANYTTETRATLTAHELGHALGLAWDDSTDNKGVDKHSNKQKNVMYKNADLGAELNSDQCAKARESPLLKDSTDECEPKPAET